MTETQTNPGGMGKAGMILGIIALVITLLPLVSAWFLIVYWLGYVLGVVGLVLSIIGLVKRQQHAIIGAVLCALSFVMPSILAESYAKAAVKTTVETLDTAVQGVNQLQNTYNSMDWGEEDDEDYF